MISAIDLDQQKPTARSARPRPTWWQAGAAAAAAVLATLGAVVVVDRRQPPALAPAVVFNVLLDMSGDGIMQYGAVWTDTRKFFPVALEQDGSYANAMMAVVTVLAAPRKNAECRIVVDYQTVDIETAADDHVATCVWYRR